MSNVNLKKFVDINIQKHITAVVSGTRDTVVLLTKEGSGDDVIFESYTQAQEILTPASTYTRTLAYLNVYFNNGGIKCLVHRDSSLDLNKIKAYIDSLDNKYIIVAYTGTDSLEMMVNVASARELDEDVYGVNEKLLLTNIPLSDISSMSNVSIKNLAIKVSSVIGAEMTMAAYLSKINVYGIDTVYDYAFSAENIAEENINDSQYDLIMAYNMNVDIELSNRIRNVGGNCKDGAEITNNYVRIVLHQTLTDRLIDVLVQKIKDTSGLGKIYNAIVQELNRYRINGYLTNDEIWLDDDLTVTGGDGKEYTVITKGTMLQNGYQIRILPMSSLSIEDKALHKAPKIYIVLADQYGIRKITINGEII